MEGEWTNTYNPCSKHKNGHSNHCLGCELDTRRDLLTEIANGELILTDEVMEKVTVRFDQKTWKSISGLRVTRERKNLNGIVGDEP